MPKKPIIVGLRVSSGGDISVLVPFYQIFQMKNCYDEYDSY